MRQIYHYLFRVTYNFALGTYGEFVGEGRNKKYVASINRMYIFIYKCSLTEVTDIDVIACPTNGNMGFGAGLAKHIEAKAGSAMTDECKQFVDENGPIELTQNFSSNPGNLPFKAIIHVVGPRWTDYVGKPVKCARDLCSTVINILMTVRAEGWTRVAIPAISSGEFYIRILRFSVGVLFSYLIVPNI